MGDDPTATWKNKIKWYSENNHVKDMNRIDGLPTEFEWKIFPGITALGLLEKIQSLMGSSSCQCTTTLFGEQKEMQKDVNTIHRQLRIILVNSLTVIGLSWGLDHKRNGTALTLADATGSSDQTAENMMNNFSDSGRACERGELKSKGGGRKSLHFNGSDENNELLLRTVMSAIQFSVYGAVADLSDELSEGFRLLGNLKHLIIWKRWKFLSHRLERKTQNAI